jgi:SAM-dependent methyltransferase
MNKTTQEADLAALRGNPSFVWRDGQERRLAMVRQYVPLEGQRVLDIGCGVGMYLAAFTRFTPDVVGVEIEHDRARQARTHAQNVSQAVGEALPFAADTFDVVFSHEVLEHVREDRQCAAEMVRVTQPGGHIAVFVPNRLYPFETHGIYWRGHYRFGNKPFVNWLPNRLRDRLAPHVRAYTRRSLRRLFADLPVRIVVHTQIYPGYDNIIGRRPRMGRMIQKLTYALERTPMRRMGLSHFLVLQVVPANHNKGAS